MERILAPIDGSENAERALRFAAELSRRYDARLDVVHITDIETDSTRELLDRADEILDDEGILDLVEEEGYDHVVMGHHGAGTVERLLLGSATETVIRANAVSVTVIPCIRSDES